jgi:hypothetical protein
MKKAVVAVLAAVAASFVVAGCATGAPQQAQQQQWAAIEPPFVQAAQANPPEDAFIGIGTGRALTANAAQTMAANRARVAIAQQMNSSVRNMITDYTGTSEIEPAMLQFFETVSRTLSEATLVGSVPNTQTFQADGGGFEAWTVMTMPRANANAMIANASQSAAALAPHANAALWAEDRMDAAFAQRDTPTVVRD